MRRAIEWIPSVGAARKMFVAFCVCPECGGTFAISKKTHTVDANGEVNPSMICPGCPFHAWVTLENWEGE